MKAYEIVLFMLILNASFGIIGATGIFRSNVPNELEGTINQDLMNTHLQANEGGIFSFVSEALTYSEYYADAISLFFGMFITTTIGLPQMLYNEPFNLPLQWVMLIMSLVIMTYVAGIIFMLRGVNPRD